MKLKNCIVDESVEIDNVNLIKGNLYTHVGHGNTCILRFVNLCIDKNMEFEYVCGEDTYCHYRDNDKLIGFADFSTFYQVYHKDCLISF